MIKYWYSTTNHGDESGFETYRASEVDTRIAELERELNRATRGDVSPIVTTLGDALTRIAKLENALRRIAELDYANAATNGAAYDAVQIAKSVL